MVAALGPMNYRVTSDPTFLIVAFYLSEIAEVRIR